MTWYYNGEPLTDIPEGVLCFVYMITNTLDGRVYFGKKLFYFTKQKVVNGKKKRVKYESDWRDYFGSSSELQSDVETLGSEHFSRTILDLCKNKGTASYLEARYQFDNRVLERQSETYNRAIQIRTHFSHVKIGE